MTKKEIKDLWGSHLYNKLAPWIDGEGYILEDWGHIVEDNFHDWDNDYNDTFEKSNIYQRMYNLDFEPHPQNEELIRPKP